MNRKLVIVLNAGPNKDLQGIDKDVENYVRYFGLPEGGLWDFSEDGDAICFETNSITADAFLRFISDVAGRENVDYWLIVFAGHGGSDPNKVDVLEICPEQRGVISDCSIREIRQAIGANTRAVLITDCCRGLIPAYESGGRIEEGLFSATSLEGDEYKQDCVRIYNDYCMRVPLGAFFVAQSCSYEESAGGSTKGGYYSYNLLAQAKELIKKQKKEYLKPEFNGAVYSLSYVHSLAAPLVIQQAARRGEEQNPEYSGPRCNQPPFCVIGRNPRRMVFG